jgi:hypothetical protein
MYLELQILDPRYLLLDEYSESELILFKNNKYMILSLNPNTSRTWVKIWILLNLTVYTNMLTFILKNIYMFQVLGYSAQGILYGRCGKRSIS